MTTNDIALRQASEAAIPRAATGLVEWAQAAAAAHALATSLVTTTFVPQQYRDKPGEATAAILAGAEIGLNPMASLRAFDNIQGTAAPKALTLVAVAQAQGHEVEVIEESATRAVVRYRRKGSLDWKESEWTIEDAQKLGLTNKDNWKKQARAMLVARASAQAARRVAADALLGIAYSSEELRDADLMTPATIVTAPRVTAAEILGAAPTPENPVVDVPTVVDGEVMDPDEPDGWDK